MKASFELRTTQPTSEKAVKPNITWHSLTAPILVFIYLYGKMNSILEQWLLRFDYTDLLFSYSWFNRLVQPLLVILLTSDWENRLWVTNNSPKPGQSIVVVVLEDGQTRDISIHGAQGEKKDEKEKKKRKTSSLAAWAVCAAACAKNSCSHLHRNSIKYRRVHAHYCILDGNTSLSTNVVRDFCLKIY